MHTFRTRTRKNFSLRPKVPARLIISLRNLFIPFPFFPCTRIKVSLHHKPMLLATHSLQPGTCCTSLSLPMSNISFFFFAPPPPPPPPPPQHERERKKKKGDPPLVHSSVHPKIFLFPSRHLLPFAFYSLIPPRRRHFEKRKKRKRKMSRVWRFARQRGSGCAHTLYSPKLHGPTNSKKNATTWVGGGRGVLLFRSRLMPPLVSSFSLGTNPKKRECVCVSSPSYIFGRIV